MSLINISNKNSELQKIKVNGTIEHKMQRHYANGLRK